MISERSVGLILLLRAVSTARLFDSFVCGLPSKLLEPTLIASVGGPLRGSEFVIFGSNIVAIDWLRLEVRAGSV